MAKTGREIERKEKRERMAETKKITTTTKGGKREKDDVNGLRTKRRLKPFRPLYTMFVVVLVARERARKTGENRFTDRPA